MSSYLTVESLFAGEMPHVTETHNWQDVCTSPGMKIMLKMIDMNQNQLMGVVYQISGTGEKQIYCWLFQNGSDHHFVFYDPATQSLNTESNLPQKEGFTYQIDAVPVNDSTDYLADLDRGVGAVVIPEEYDNFTQSKLDYLVSTIRDE